MPAIWPTPPTQPKTNYQTTNQYRHHYIHIITRSTTIFSSNLRKWHAKPEAEKPGHISRTIWRPCKRTSRRVSSQPSRTTDSLDFHEQANASTASLVDEVIDRLSTQCDTTATSIAAETISEQQMQQQITNMLANSTQQSQQQILEQMTAALTSTVSSRSPDIKINSNNTNTNNQNQGWGGNHERNSGGRGGNNARNAAR
jgi:hypothetical protein